MEVMITGGANGIGKEAVKNLKDEHRVTVIDKDEESLNSLEGVEKLHLDITEQERSSVKNKYEFRREPIIRLCIKLVFKHQLERETVSVMDGTERSCRGINLINFCHQPDPKRV